MSSLRIISQLTNHFQTLMAKKKIQQQVPLTIHKNGDGRGRGGASAQPDLYCANEVPTAD